MDSPKFIYNLIKKNQFITTGSKLNPNTIKNQEAEENRKS